MNERDFIDLLRPLAARGAVCDAFNFNDDAATITPPDGQDLVISSDTMVEGVHFPTGRIGGGFSERLLRTALSDLAAKGARPIAYTLNLSWPKARDPKWPRAFVQGLSDTQASFDLALLGGDMTSTTGPLVASAVVYGFVPHGMMISRSGAQAGDDIWYTGVLGRAAHGLKIVLGETVDLSPDEFMACEEAYLRPEPRFLFRKTLRAHATACADISDGLLSEAGHIAAASRICMHLDRIDGADFGDDYELLLTANPNARGAILAGADAIGLKLTRCGHVEAGEGVRVNGNRVRPEGYRHKF